MKKSKIILTVLIIIIDNCTTNNDRQADALYKNFSEQLLVGNFKEAEKKLDSAILLQPQNEKFLNSKLSILLNRCDKKDALIVIDEILKKNSSNSTILLTKAILLPEKNTEKKKILNKIENYLYMSFKNSKSRDKIIPNLILVEKLLGLENYNIEKKLDFSKLNKKEKDVYNNYINLSNSEIHNIFFECN